MRAHFAAVSAFLCAAGVALTLEAQPREPGLQGATGAQVLGGPTDGPGQYQPDDRMRVEIRGRVGAGGTSATGGPSFGDERVDASVIGTDSMCPNRIDSEPLVIYDLSGSTLIGLYHLRLAAYSNGNLSVTEIDPLRAAPTAAFRILDDAVVRALRDDLLAAGADQLCDDTVIVIDSPLATMTVFRADGSAHSFSYFPVLGDGPWKAAEAAVQGFLAANFPEVLEE